MKKLFFIFLFLSSLASAEVIVIANPSVKSTTISKSELRNVFTGESARLSNGTRVNPVLLKQGGAHSEFLAAYLGKSESVFRAGWRAQVFAGETMMPKSFDSEAAIVEYVAQTPGAIGYVSGSTPHPGVVVLAVK